MTTTSRIPALAFSPLFTPNAALELNKNEVKKDELGMKAVCSGDSERMVAGSYKFRWEVSMKVSI